MPSSQNKDVEFVLRPRGTKRCRATGQAAGPTPRLLNPRGGGDTEVSSANWRLPAYAELEIQPPAAVSRTAFALAAAAPGLVTTLINRHSPKTLGSAHISATFSEITAAECCAICTQSTVSDHLPERRATPRGAGRSTS